MSAITTHVLDTAAGRPAADVPVRLEHRTSDGWSTLADARTDEDGRVTDWLASEKRLDAGTYRLIFETGAYLGQGPSFYPRVTVEFVVHDPAQHYHVPLLLSPFGYSTYRGS